LNGEAGDGGSVEIRISEIDGEKGEYRLTPDELRRL
jgi:hypothetical protein